MLRLNGLVAVIVFAALTVVVSLQVLNRLVLQWPIIWSEEVARFLFFWVVMLGAAISVRRRRHFVLDLTRGGPRRTAGGLRRVAVALVPNACVLGFSVFLLLEGIGYMRTGIFRTATNSDVNMALVYAAIPVFAALSIAYAAANLLADYRAIRAGHPVEPRPLPAE
jgi:TRAP-type C4-dicarboxylate transport system permease small subunit